MQPLAEGDGIVIPAMDGHKNGARDPKVFWHDASKQWVLVLWERDGHTGLYTSKNLRSWKTGPSSRSATYENSGGAPT